jgi:hypothetical protein
MAKWYSEDPEYSSISKVDYDVRLVIEKVLAEYTREMEGYSYYGSNPGIPEDVYDDVAEDIMTKLNLWEKKDD